MTTSSSPLTAWVANRKGAADPLKTVGGPTLRFAFYARMSTAEFQDRASSRSWQLEAATELIGGHGRVVAEYIDVGHTRRRPWSRRPRATALLEALAAPDRPFDAIVVGEYERAFAGRQLQALLPILDARGVALWLPELDGPIHSADPVHAAALLHLAARSKQEIQRARFRVLAAMRAQVLQQGRYQGGRPPYGYLLADAGPHPNGRHAQWGRQLHRLEPDPATAINVIWMFAQRLAGRSIASIARNLNDARIPSPSNADPDRNPHRATQYWTTHTVASILANPRYTGRQVWNRQGTDHPLDEAADETAARRWNPGADWSLSPGLAHPGLVSEEDFVTAQAIDTRPRRATRTYALSGLVRCRPCGRTMQPTGSTAGPATAAATAGPALSP